MKNNNKDWYLILTGLIFTCLVFLSKFLIKVFWNGIKYIWRNKKSKWMILLISITIAITVFFIIKYNGDDIRQAYCLLPIPIFLFTTGCINKILHTYLNEYSKIFENINFKSKSGQFPKIIKTQKYKNKNKTRTILIVKSMIPLNEWNKNKDLLENAFNSKIAIKSTQNRQIIKLIKLGV
jgi:hypothetical protein